MRTIASSQFRIIYASLTEPAVVTVNGHKIGTWYPATEGPVTVAEVRATRPFTPAPKPVAPSRPTRAYR